MKLKFYHTVAVATAILTACALPCTAGATADIAREVSPDFLMECTAREIEDVHSIDGELNLDLGANLEMTQSSDEGAEISAKVDFDCSVNASFKSVFDENSHVKGALTVDSPVMEDGAESQTFEVYMDNTGDAPAVYSNTGYGWMKDSMDEKVDFEEIKGALEEALVEIGKSDDIEYEDTELNGRTMHKLSSSVKWDDISKDVSFYQNIGGVDIDQIADAENAEVYVALYIYHDLPARLELGLTEDSGDVSGDIGGGILSIEDFLLTLDLNGYNEFDSISIPDDVINYDMSVVYDEKKDDALEVMSEVDAVHAAEEEAAEAESGEELVTDLASKDGSVTAHFEPYGTFDDCYSAENYLSFSDSNMEPGSPEVVMTFRSVPAKDAAQEGRDAEADFYENPENGNFVDTSCSEVQETEVDGRKAYLYVTKYTDSDLSYKAYNCTACIEIDDESCLSFEFDELFDQDGEMPEDDEAFFEALSHLTIG